MKVWLLGDSIRMFYQKEVIARLGDDYEVYAPAENCRFSSYMLNSIRFWIREFPTPDIIHFNAGLWDTAILYPEDGSFIGLEEYVKYMGLVIRELKKTGAKLIFATTTPVHDEKVHLPGPMPPAHRNEDIQRYNAAVLQAYQGEDCRINDLYAQFYPHRMSYLSDDLIHPNREGVAFLADLVAKAIRDCGSYQNPRSSEPVIPSKKEEKTIQSYRSSR